MAWRGRLRNLENDHRWTPEETFVRSLTIIQSASAGVTYPAVNREPYVVEGKVSKGERLPPVYRTCHCLNELHAMAWYQSTIVYGWEQGSFYPPWFKRKHGWEPMPMRQIASLDDQPAAKKPKT